MRIIAGQWGGRNFASPHSHRTHPMSEKARGALFNTLGDIQGLHLLDAFGGSGALALEAASRGANPVLVIEKDRVAQAIIAQNIRTLGAKGAVTLASAAAGAWLATQPEARFDIILCDPPYDDLQPHLLQLLSARLQPNGIFVLSLPASAPSLTFPHTELLKQQHYGDAQLLFFRQKK